MEDLFIKDFGNILMISNMPRVILNSRSIYLITDIPLNYGGNMDVLEVVKKRKLMDTLE